MTLNSELKNYLESAVQKLNLPQHPYFKALCSGELSREQFVETQKEFATMVFFFSRPMAQIIANVPDPIPRIAIVENLWEEHGQGIQENVHGNTILTLINRLGGDASSVNIHQPPLTARVFNETLRSVSSFSDYRFASAVYAGIERTFVDASSMIYESILNQGWLEEKRITHYGLHKEIDIEHAEDFLKVVNNNWHDEVAQVFIKDGIQFGSHLLSSAYTGFYHSL